MTLSARYAQHLLEGKIPEDLFEAQKKASSVSWKPDWFRPGDWRSAEEDVVFRRHDNTLRFVIPWIEKFASLDGAHIIDFGCGCGSSSLAFSRYARHVDGFEIDPVSAEAARLRSRLFGSGNISVHQAGPREILAEAANRVTGRSVVVLLAVVEHLLEEEQVDYLRELWSRMKPGQLLVIAETPNYYAWLDTHTFQIPFASMVPDALFPEFLRRSPAELRFRDTMLGGVPGSPAASILERRRRFGLGVTHHAFEQAFEQDLSELIVGDGFDEPILHWFGVQADDQLLLSGFEVHKVMLPIGFARSVLSFVFRKPADAAEAAATRGRNAHRRKEIIERYGAFYERRMLRQRVRELEQQLAAKSVEEPRGLIASLKKAVTRGKS